MNEAVARQHAQDSRQQYSQPAVVDVVEVVVVVVVEVAAATAVVVAAEHSGPFWIPVFCKL